MAAMTRAVAVRVLDWARSGLRPEPGVRGRSGIWGAVVILCLALSASAAEQPQPVETAGLPNVAQALEAYTAAVTSYTVGTDSRALSAVEEIVRKASPAQYREIEAWLLSCLQRPEATADFKAFACRLLQPVGSAAAVSVVAPLLLDEHLSHMAILALQHVPEPSVDEALSGALPRAAGKLKAGIINSMGERRQSRNVSILAGVLDDPDAAISTAAVVALGKIGDAQSLESLARARTSSNPAVREAATRASLDYADRMLVQGRKDQAKELFDTIYASENAKGVRAGAFRGCVTARGEDGISLLTDAIKAGTPELWFVAMQLAREIPGTHATEQLAALTPALAGLHKAELLYALADRGDLAALPALSAAMHDAGLPDDETSKAAAYDAMAILADGPTALAFVKAAATGDPRADALRECVKRMSGKGVSAALIGALDTANTAFMTELIRMLTARRAAEATVPLLTLAGGPDTAVRLEALKALESLGREDALPQLLDLLTGAATDAENEAVSEALASIASCSAGNPQRTVILVAALGKARSARARSGIVAALGYAGDEGALDAVRASIQDSAPDVQDAAIRALAAWPSPRALPVLLEIAKTSPRMSHRILALRGYVRLLEQVQDWSAEKRLDAYRQVMDLATRAEEKKQVLGGVSTVASPEALSFAASYLNHPELVRESVAAVLRIAAAIAETQPSQAEAALVQVLQVSQDNEDVRKAAENLLGKLRATPHP